MESIPILKNNLAVLLAQTHLNYQQEIQAYITTQQQTVNLLRAIKGGEVTLDQITISDDAVAIAPPDPGANGHKPKRGATQAQKTAIPRTPTGPNGK